MAFHISALISALLCSCSCQECLKWCSFFADCCCLLIIRLMVRREESASKHQQSTTTEPAAVAKNKAESKQEEKSEKRERDEWMEAEKSIWLSIEKSSHHKFIWMWKNITQQGYKQLCVFSIEAKKKVHSPLIKWGWWRRWWCCRFFHFVWSEEDWRGFHCAGMLAIFLPRSDRYYLFATQPTNKYKDFMYHG